MVVQTSGGGVKILLDCITTCGVDSIGLKHLNNIDTSLIKSSLAFRNLIDKIIGWWWGSLANYAFGGFLDTGGEIAFIMVVIEALMQRNHKIN